MPRGPRDDAPGVAHHIMARGIERSAIFRDDRDRRELVRRLSRTIPELDFRCYAWALLPNHLHIVVQSKAARVSRLMARLGTGYARYFNERHDRVGHLFQNRFRSRRVVDDRDLVGLILYVCRNPLEGGLVPDPTELERFRWCSVGALTGRRTAFAFESVADTLALFDTDPARARGQLREHLGTAEPAQDAVVARPSREAGAEAEEARTSCLLELLREICGRCGVTEVELRSRRRDQRLSGARAILAARASRELGASGSEIARALGVTRSAVSRMLDRDG